MTQLQSDLDMRQSHSSLDNTLGCGSGAVTGRGVGFVAFTYLFGVITWGGIGAAGSKRSDFGLWVICAPFESKDPFAGIVL